MRTFTYVAIDARGREIGGSVDAESADAAVTGLRRAGLHPVQMTEAGAAKGADKARRRGPRWPARNRFTLRELAAFTRQLATLLAAGLPLARGLEVLARQASRAPARRVVASLEEQVRSGSALSDAMAAHPGVFDRKYVSMVRAGEAGGTLDDAFGRVADHLEKSARLHGRVRAAMIYPAVVISVACVILAGLLVFVVPRFERMFSDLLRGAPLPPLTRFVIDAGGRARDHGPALAGCVAAGWIAMAALRRLPACARAWDRALLALPMAGGLAQQAATAGFARTLGSLLASGVPILQALLITRETCGNAWVAHALEAAHDRVQAGEPLSRALAAGGVFPAALASLVEVGEHTGRLAEMLRKTADIYEDEVDNAVAGLGALLEPALVLFMALVVGVIVIALFLPIVRIVQLLS